MKSDDKTLIILLAIFLIVLVVSIAINVVISFVLALCIAQVTSWFGSNILMEHLPELTAIIFFLYTFIAGSIQINTGKTSNG